MCPKCKNKAISKTNDGEFGWRNHCLNCGWTWEAKPDPDPEKKKETKK